MWLVQVRETQKTIRDGRTNMESMTIARGMGEQVRLCTAQSSGRHIDMQQGKNCLPGCFDGRQDANLSSNLQLGSTCASAFRAGADSRCAVVALAWFVMLTLFQERVVTRTRDANGNLITEEHNAGWSRKPYLMYYCLLDCFCLVQTCSVSVSHPVPQCET
jgi:hypothetical protein